MQRAEELNAEQASSESFKDLKMERVKQLVETIKSVVGPLEELTSATQEIQTEIEQQLASYALSLRTTKLKPEELDAFFKKPYLTLPVPGKRENWYFIIPRFIDIQIGWLDRQTEAYNIFLVNRYVDWLGEIPEEIKKQLGFKPGLRLELQGDQLVGPREDLEKAWGKFRPFLKDRDDKRITINKKRAFDLIASLVKDGILPFTPKPIDEADLVERPVDFELRDYQREAWNRFKQYSNIGVFYPASVGKTFISLYAMSRIKGPHIVAVPTRLLVEQWVDRIEAHTQLKVGVDVIVGTYQTVIRKHANREWMIKVIDEVHHMPANDFSKLALVKSKYILGLTASPTREDNREEYIFALTGYPVGLGWQHFKEIGVIKSPLCNVWIVKNFEAKMARLRALLMEEKKTLIFSDSLDVGKTIAAKFSLPFVHGATKDRLDTIKDAPVSVISRVGDEGVSLPDIERVIEMNWLFGSRRQELQRFTRLLHGQKGEGEHHIIMTLDEYQHDRKRLFSIMDKGFKVEIRREGVSEQAMSQKMGTAPPAPRKRASSKQPAQESSPAPLSEGTITGVMALPGVVKIMAGLKSSQKRVYELLLQNDGQWFKKSSLPLLLGYTSENSMKVSVNFPEMARRGLIEQRQTKEGMEYRTNIRSRVGG